MRAQLRNLYLNIMGRLKHPKPGIHIIHSHYVTPHKVNLDRDTEIFENYLKVLSRFAKFITLPEATQGILNDDIPKDEVLIAFTFDDAFEECYDIISPLLEKYNTRGAFFINANYIESTQTYQNEFNKRVLISTKKPMSWQQVKNLHNRGHLIGSHNLDHTDFSKLENTVVESQIKNNKEILEKKLNYQCKYFAWTFGQLQHFPNRALEITSKYHPYIYSGTNFKYYFSMNGQVINRRHQEAFWPKPHLKYFISIEKKFNR